MTEPDATAEVKKRFTEMFPNHQVLVKTANVGLDIFRNGDLVA